MKLSQKTILIGISTLVVAGAGLAYYFITKDKGDVLGWMSSSWIYRKSVAVANSGSTLTNEDVLITLDSEALVSTGKLQADCDDFRFSDSDGTTSLDYWIEDGCNTTSTKIWVRIPSLTAGGKTIYMYYGNDTVGSGALAWGGNVIMFADTACPTGWTRAADLDNKFLYGGTTYGTTGGTSSHTHDSTCTSSSISTTSIAGTIGGSLSATTIAHTHTNLKATLLSTTVVPPYTGMIACYKNSFLLSQGLVSMFTSTPSGWTRFSALDSKFPEAQATYGEAGGSSTHTHSTTTGYATDTTSGTQSLTPSFTGAGGTVTYSGGYTIHTFTSGGTFTANVAGSVQVLVVGGGGSTGGGLVNVTYHAGGGGGKVVYNSSFPLNAQAYSVTIGAGGSGDNVNGQDSVFSTITALHGNTGYSTAHGGASGSGYAGGAWTGSGYGGGGGGGAGGGGYYNSGNTGGSGGVGITSAISGSTITYGIGGVGGPNSNLPGAANTGNGGGGNQGNGGSGIVIIRYLTPSGSASTYASSTHTHTTNSATSSTVSNLPPYLDMIFAKADSNQYVTESNILITSVLPPLGWTRFTELDNKFARGASTYGATGGAATHTHSVSMTTGGPSNTINGGGTGTNYTDPTHTHSCTATSDTGSSIPPYATVIYAQRKISQITTIGAEELENHPPTATSLLTEEHTNPIDITDLTPEFSAIFTDSDSTSDTGTYYQIEVNTAPDFTGAIMWDSTKTAISPILSSGNRSIDISYNGTTLSDGITYYWRIKFWDNNSYANEGNWTVAQFTTYKNEWQSTDLPYRRAIIVGNTSGEVLTNEDVLVTLDTATLVTEGKLQNDCDDLRFTASDGSSALKYWVEGGCNTTATKVWVRIPSLLQDGNTIYAYYGNNTLANGEELWNGNIYMYADTSCPTGWTRATDLDGKFLYGGTTYGTPGGSDSHSQGDATCTSSSISDTSIAGTITGALSSASTSHTHANLKATLLSTSAVLPPYTSSILCYKNSFLFSQGLISMFDTSTSSGWTNVSALNGSFIRADSNYGTTGGSSTHTHSVTTGYTTATPGDTQTLLTNFSATGGTITTSGSYTIHTFTSSGTFAVQGSGPVDAFLVAGGSSVGLTTTGGRGGQVIYNSAYSVSEGNITVTVGGAGANSAFGSLTASGGGGAMGGTGGSSQSPGATGTLSPIDGLYYGGGGGGGACCSNGSNGYLYGGPGGNRGGGYGGGVGWWEERGKWYGDPGGPGSANTGGGGGGGGCGVDYGQANGGAGGSGIIIIRYVTQASTGAFASGTHTHTSTNASVSSGSNTPPYLDMVFSKSNSESYVTDHNVLITSEIPPLGWGRYTALDNKFPKAASTFGETGGSATHTHSVDISSGAPSTTINGTGSGTNFASSTHTHSCTTASNSASNLPAYTNVIYIQRKSSQIATVGTENEENHEPNAPTALQTNSVADNNKITISSPKFSAIFTDGGTSDTGNYYQVQVNTSSDFTGTTMWDSTKIAFSSPIVKNTRSSDISYAGNTLIEGETYYWRIKFWDNNLYANESVWSSTSFFIMSGIPDIASSLQTNDLYNPTQLTRVPPNFTAVYTDINGDNASAYQIQVNTSPLFTGTIMWDSGKLATTVTSGSRSPSYSYAGLSLTNSNNTLYWRIKFWDIDNTTNDWSSTAQFIDTFSSTYYEGLKLNGLKLD